jgi:ubiquinone/menaquinone biosynthesis C-methylase UbiE
MVHRHGGQNVVSTVQQPKAYKGWGMEGLIARWYARNTGKMIDQYQKAAHDVAAALPSGSHVLEVAPGPGYFAIELARLGSYHIVGLDISHSFVRIATENARAAGLEVEFRQGNASGMPFESNTFDFIYCRAAFKNFAEPVEAIKEMYRVLKPGGTAVISDLRKDASPGEINAAIQAMRLGWLDSVMTRWIFQHSLLKRAYLPEDFRRLASQTPFGSCEVKPESIGMEASLRK